MDLDVVLSDNILASALLFLGATFAVSEELFHLHEVIVCRMYGSKKHNSVNELCYDLFATKALQSDQLPPTEDALRQHAVQVMASGERPV